MQIKTVIKKPVTGDHKVAKTPMIMQMEALECGAAALAMVMAYYNKWIPLEQVRADCGVSRDGSKARNMLKAARQYGMEAKGYRYEPETLRKEGFFPCIIHWNFDHFVVLCGFKGNKAVINDPASGIQKIDMAQFDAAFTGICLMMQPGEDFVPGGKRKSILGFVKKRLSGTKAAICFTVLSTLIASVFGIIDPIFPKVLIDRLLGQKNPEWAVPFLIFLVLFTVMQIITSFVQTRHQLKLTGKMATTANTTFMWHLFKLPMNFFSQRMAGDIQQRQMSNIPIAENVINTFTPLIFDSVMMVLYLLVMLKQSVLLSIVGVASILINVAVSRMISTKRVNIVQVAARDSGKLAGATVAGINMIETIKASGAEDGFFEKWGGYQAAVNAQSVKETKVNMFFGMIPGLVDSAANIIVMVLGVYLTMQGHFTIGMVMGFQGLLSSFSTPATMLVHSGQMILEMRTEMERVEDIMEYPEEVVFAGEGEIDLEQTYKKLTGKVEIKDLTFGYSPLAEPLITDFNLTLYPGKKVALVGASGCGKSTVAKLISGLYQPWSGEILFDGRPMKAINKNVFKSSVTVVDQDIVLFEDTVSANIKMWDNTISDEAMFRAAKDAQIHDGILKRGLGYKHRITEGGRDFSGGERQRLEIARALAIDPSIIIMDEATSALDAKTEYETVKAIDKRNITCVIVAHRLSTIRDCDEIIVLDKGRIVERGTHDELFAKGGYYSQLVTNE